VATRCVVTEWVNARLGKFDGWRDLGRAQWICCCFTGFFVLA
jgi:hypothetical protein